MPQNDGSNEQSETGNVLEFPTGRNVTEIKTVLESSRANGLLLTPLQLLGVILKVVLRERITDAEIDKISAVYYDTIAKWY